jgi:hypothetical protein
MSALFARRGVSCVIVHGTISSHLENGKTPPKRLEKNKMRKLLLALVVLFFAQHVSSAQTRDPRLQPFSAASFWNTPLGTGAQFQAATDTETAMLMDPKLGNVWIGANAIGVYSTAPTDPVMRWTYKARSMTGKWLYRTPISNGSFSVKTPSNIKFHTVDGWSVFMTEDARYEFETWLGAYDATTNAYTVTYVAMNDLYGDGIPTSVGRSEGIRAFGGSLLGGLIRCHELTASSIPHAVAMEIAPTRAKAGRIWYQQRVWPAQATDSGSVTVYSGTIPMGALFGIPQSTDLTKLGLLTKEGMALAQAYKSFGGYVVDTATHTTMIGVVEADCDATQIGNLSSDKAKILHALRMITNNEPNTIGGPGERVVPPPPDFAPLK